MDYTFINDDLKKKIETTKFVFMVARASTGKTFSGDYLEVVRGWKHVDGDIPAKNMATNPEYRKAAELMFGLGEHEGKSDPFDGILEHQKPYFEILARLTLEAARDSDRVVMTHATYSRPTRDYFRKLLLDAGARDVSTVFLHCDPEIHAKSLWGRLNRQAADSGIPLGKLLAMWGAGDIEETLEAFTAWFLESAQIYLDFEEAQETEQPYTIVNTSARDETVMDRLDAVVGIDPNEFSSRGEENFEDLVQKIKAIDAQRDMASYEEINKILEKHTASDEDAKAELEMARTEPKKLAARRSSLLDAQKVEHIRRSSSIGIGIERGSSSNSALSSLLSDGRRRASFITQGII